MAVTVGHGVMAEQDGVTQVKDVIREACGMQANATVICNVDRHGCAIINGEVLKNFILNFFYQLIFNPIT